MRSQPPISSARRITWPEAPTEACRATRAATRAVRHLAPTLASIALLSGCIGDPPPDPENQPLEIIAGNPDPTYGPCVLNVDEVGAGTHEVMPLTLAGEARVRILDPSGAVVFKRRIEEHSTEGGGSVENVAGTVRLESGDYRVECILADRTHSTSLRVVPARPGH
jgi:hypothetical protein